MQHFAGDEWEAEENGDPTHGITRAVPTPIVALDFPSAARAMELVDRLPSADFYKIGLQLFTAAGPDFVRSLKDRGFSIFLDLKFHDIPNTVSGAVRAAAGLEVDILTVHASGGPTMLRAAVDAANSCGSPPAIFAVTVLTSLGTDELGCTWGRERLDAAAEVLRLARLADAAGVAGVVASLHEVNAIRGGTRPDFPVLTPGIRLPGDLAGDQVRVGTPAEAAAVGATYVVLGRSVTAAPEPEAAFAEVTRQLATPSS